MPSSDEAEVKDFMILTYTLCCGKTLREKHEKNVLI